MKERGVARPTAVLKEGGKQRQHIANSGRPLLARVRLSNKLLFVRVELALQYLALLREHDKSFPLTRVEHADHC